MNGAQDLGGMFGFGPVLPEADEPPFHEDWERRVLAITLAMGATGQWNIDMSRAARESLPPAQYLASSYYEIWLAGLQRLLLARGLATREEIDDGTARVAAKPGLRVLAADRVTEALARGSSTLRPVPAPARFRVGDCVRTREMNPPTHTRLPRYCRDKQGQIVRVHGVHCFPDTNAAGRGEDPQWLYSVCFSGTELWGPDTTVSSVCVDCFEPYLEPRPGANL